MASYGGGGGGGRGENGGGELVLCSPQPRHTRSPCPPTPQAPSSPRIPSFPLLRLSLWTDRRAVMERIHTKSWRIQLPGPPPPLLLLLQPHGTPPPTATLFLHPYSLSLHPLSTSLPLCSAVSPHPRIPLGPCRVFSDHLWPSSLLLTSPTQIFARPQVTFGGISPRQCAPEPAGPLVLGENCPMERSWEDWGWESVGCQGP